MNVLSMAEEGTFQRDPFGVEPFYYSLTSGGLVFSSSLEQVLSHPDVCFEAIDARAAGDYLLHGVCNDASATIYANIRRLPPGHTLAFRRGAIDVTRSWRLPDPAPRRSARAEFEEALRAAIRERLTAPAAVVFMSGGLDSPTLAALAREVAPHVELTAQTSVYRSRIRDIEEPFAVEAARSIGVPIRVVPLDEFEPLQSLDDGHWTPDPGALLTRSMTLTVHGLAAERAPIAMHGHPADAVLEPRLMSYLRGLGSFERLAALIQYTLIKKRPPFFYYRDRLNMPRSPAAQQLRPAWLKAPAHDDPPSAHPLESPAWSNYYEWAHPAMTGIPLDMVYPWADTRVVEAALAMPSIPWLVDKHVLREILRGRVSERIRKRPKASLAGDPAQVALPVPRDLEIRAASAFIDPDTFRGTIQRTQALSDSTLRAVAFEYWFRELPGRVQSLRTGSMVK